MMTPENDLVLSISPAFSNSNSRRSQVTPELMQVSPFADDLPNNSEVMMEEMLYKWEWLEMEKNNLSVQIDAISSKSSQVIDSLSEDKLKELYEELKENLLKRNVIHDGREMIMKGECLNQATLSIVQCDLDGDADKLSLERKRELENILDEYSALTSQVAREHQESVELKARLETVKKENFEFLQKSRQLYIDIGERKKAKEEELVALMTNEDGKSIHEQLQSKLQLNTIQNNTLQMLILGSGLNWNQDKKLKKLMLDCGKSVPI